MLLDRKCDCTKLTKNQIIKLSTIIGKIINEKKKKLHILETLRDEIINNLKPSFWFSIGVVFNDNK